MARHVTTPVTALADELPSWARLVRAPNPGPMTLDGTNTWVLRGPGAPAALVVDPGPDDEGHLRAVAALGPVAWIAVTHGHLDHTEGVSRLVALTGARRWTGQPLDNLGLTIDVLATPGHTADSICLRVSGPGGAEPAVLTGDTILGRGTTVVAWPDGDLADYLDSLRLLTGSGPVPALPGHGPPLRDCAAAAGYYLAHRRARLDQVRAAREAGAVTAAEVVAVVYADVDRVLWSAAEWSVRAQLAYLDRESSDGGHRLDRP